MRRLNLAQRVNGIASTPFNVAAGGTDFDITAATGWSKARTGVGETVPTPVASRMSLTNASAKSYIPETTWNDSCAQNFTGLTHGL